MDTNISLARLLSDFDRAGLRRKFSSILSENLDLLPLADLSTRLFQDDKAAYAAWLQGRHVSLGSMTPLEILVSHNDPEHWSVRKELDTLILMQQGLMVEAPSFTLGYEAVTTEEGSTAWRPPSSPTSPSAPA